MEVRSWPSTPHDGADVANAKATGLADFDWAVDASVLNVPPYAGRTTVQEGGNNANFYESFVGERGESFQLGTNTRNAL